MDCTGIIDYGNVLFGLLYTSLCLTNSACIFQCL